MQCAPFLFGIIVVPDRVRVRFAGRPGNMTSSGTNEMGLVYAILRDHARRIADRLPTADFYRIHSREIERSQENLVGDDLLADMRALVRSTIENDFGHGLAHAHKVAEDAGALVLIECCRHKLDSASTERKLLVVQTAGLLHDMRRKEKQHAAAGAVFAREVLAGFAFTQQEVGEICYAIRNHEAFQRVQPPPSNQAALVSDCLYDADKFRWGPDNFTDTLWDMVTFYNPPLSAFVARYPGGMQKLEEIKATFRSVTGQRYGPQMIDFGISIGRALMNRIRTEFTHLL